MYPRMHVLLELLRSKHATLLWCSLTHVVKNCENLFVKAQNDFFYHIYKNICHKILFFLERIVNQVKWTRTICKYIFYNFEEAKYKFAHRNIDSLKFVSNLH